jgi:sigma-B regulation protein RsbU (phosphoserine phosphatase)
MTETPIAVLVIEDNPGDARLIREILTEETSARFSLEHAERLATGLDRLAAGGIDVVLLDLSLPDGRGLDTFRQAYARAPRVPIIVLTALDDEAVASGTLNAGAQDYLVKNYLNYAILHNAIRNAIERKRAEEESRRAKEAAEAAGQVENQLKDQLLVVLRDELGTTLKSMLLTASAMLDDPTSGAELQATLDLIRKQMEKEARLIDNLLDATSAPKAR